MVNVALFVRLEAKPGKEQDVESFLKSGLPLVMEEPATTAWFGIRLGPSTFGIFDAFPDEAGRQAHLSGKVAAALMANAGELLSEPPTIEKVDVLVLELDDAAAIDADEVVVRRMVEVVRVVEFVVLAEIHLAQDAALHEERERAVNGGARNGAIDLARHDEQFLRGVVLGGGKGGLHDGVTLGRLAEAFLGKVGMNAVVYFRSHMSSMRAVGEGVKLPDSPSPSSSSAQSPSAVDG